MNNDLGGETMSRALFFRKCSNSKEYFHLSKKHPEYGTEMEFEITHTIHLSTDDFFKFQNNFLEDNNKIKAVTKELFINSQGIVQCLFVTDGNPGGFLIYPSGYNYARYVAYYVPTKKGV